jgi:hypothetical protein
MNRKHTMQGKGEIALNKLWDKIGAEQRNPSVCPCCLIKMLAHAIELMMPRLTLEQRHEIQPQLAALVPTPDQLHS